MVDLFIFKISLKLWERSNFNKGSFMLKKDKVDFFFGKDIRVIGKSFG